MSLIDIDTARKYLINENTILELQIEAWSKNIEDNKKTIEKNKLFIDTVMELSEEFMEVKLNKGEM